MYLIAVSTHITEFLTNKKIIQNPSSKGGDKGPIKSITYNWFH